MGKNGCENCVSTLMDGCCALFFCVEYEAFASCTHDNTVTSILKVNALDVGRPTSYSKECSFVHEVCKICTAHARSGTRHCVKVDVCSETLVGGVHLQNGKALFIFRKRHHNLAIESARTQQGRIQDVWAVCCSKNHDAFCCFKTVHLSQHLVESLFTFIVTAAKSGATLATNGINFVNEDDGLAHFACLLKEVSYATCTHADKHLHEVRTGDGQEANACFTGNGTSKQCFTCSRRTNKQNTFWYTCTNFFEAFWHAQEINDFFDFQFHAFVASNISKGGCRLVGLIRLCLAATNGHDVARLAHCAALHPHKETNHE